MRRTSHRERGSAMSTRRFLFCASVVVVLVMTAIAGGTAAIPRKINYQARLTDSSTGQPRIGNLALTFRIYDDPLAGTLIWEEGQTLTVDSAGVVSVVLGSIVPIEIGFDDEAWLEVEVEGEVLSPRREIVSVPYAFHALDSDHAMDSDSLSGHEANDFVMSGQEGSVTAQMIVDGSGSGLNADLLDSLSSEAFSDTGHTHDGRYYLKEELNSPGTLNDSENPVDWTKLKEVPAGFADGTDDTGGVGDGHSLDAADGSPTDVVYVDAVGNVGIGTVTPDDALDIVGDADLTGDLKIGGIPVFSVDFYGNTVIGADAGYGTAGQHNTFVGFATGLANTTGSSNVFAGAYSGMANTTGNGNTLVGYSSGAANDSGWGNTFLGYLSGNSNIDADINTFIGYYSGRANTIGDGNTFLGSMSGWQNTQGEYNTCLGGGAGYSNTDGSSNTYLGYGAGQTNTHGDGNVFLGSRAGFMETGSNKLYVANDANESDVLIYGDFSTGQLSFGCVKSEYTFEFESASTKAFKIGNDEAWLDLSVSGTSRVGFGDGDGHEAGTIFASSNPSGDNFIAIWAGSDDYVWKAPAVFHENGYMGIGTLKPDREIHIVSDNPRILIEARKSNPEVNFRSSSDAFGDTWAVYKDSTSDDLRFYQSGDKVIFEGGTGNVGIGAAPGGYKLRVNGTACGTGEWQTCSDLKFKDNIRGIGDALDKVLRLRGVTFDWRRDEYPAMDFDEGTHYGCIAQEVEEILPEVVGEGPDGDKTVAYSEMVPVLIESIKAQQRQIELLEARIAELEK
jgi:hypothetical protein